MGPIPYPYHHYSSSMGAVPLKPKIPTFKVISRRTCKEFTCIGVRRGFWWPSLPIIFLVEPKKVTLKISSRMTCEEVKCMERRCYGWASINLCVDTHTTYMIQPIIVYPLLNKLPILQVNPFLHYPVLSPLGDTTLCPCGYHSCLHTQSFRQCQIPHQWGGWKCFQCQTWFEKTQVLPREGVGVHEGDITRVIPYPPKFS